MASSEGEIDRAFEKIVEQRCNALLVGSDPFLFRRHEQIISLANRNAVPAIYQQRDFATAGGLMSYGTSLSDAYYQVGIYTGRVLKGENPGDIPVLRSARFEFVINLRTAKALRLTIPPSLLARADEVIE